MRSTNWYRLLRIFPYALTPVLASALTGCAYPQLVGHLASMGGHYASVSQLPSFADAQTVLPPLAPDRMRVFVYRSSIFAGVASNVVIVIDGYWLGDPHDRDSTLVGGTVLAIDCDATQTHLSLAFNGNESRDNQLLIDSSRSRQWYVAIRSQLGGPRIELVPEMEAIAEIKELKFAGLVRPGQPM